MGHVHHGVHCTLLCTNKRALLPTSNLTQESEESHLVGLSDSNLFEVRESLAKIMWLFEIYKINLCGWGSVIILHVYSIKSIFSASLKEDTWSVTLKKKAKQTTAFSSFCILPLSSLRSLDNQPPNLKICNR